MSKLKLIKEKSLNMPPQTWEKGQVLLFGWLYEVYSIHGRQRLPSLVYVFNHYKYKSILHNPRIRTSDAKYRLQNN